MRKTVRKTLALILSILMFVSVIPMGTAFAATEGYYDYTANTVISGHRYATIESYTGEEAEVVIPDKLGGYDVIAIGESAFADNKSITKVTFPDSVKTIIQLAFSKCSNLEEVVFGAGLETIDASAFAYCTKLKEITLGANVKTISNLAFRNSDGLVVNYSGTKEQWDSINIATNAFVASGNYTVNYNFGYNCEGNGHKLAEVASNNATCETDGNIAHWICEACNKKFVYVGTELTEVADVVIPAGHSLTKTDASDYTCTVNGNLVYWTCSLCKTHFKDENASEEYADNEWVTLARHNARAIDAKEPTCFEEGNVAHWLCETCGKAFEDEELTKIIETVKIPATGNHTYDNGEVTTPPGCTTTGVKTFTCTLEGCGATRTEDIEATGHTPADAVKEKEVPMTCDKDGSYDLVVYCEICEEELSRVTETVAHGHHIKLSFPLEYKTPATCTEPATTETWCYRCEQNIVIPVGEPLGHTEVTAPDKAPTCEEAGCIGGTWCGRCKVYITEPETIDPLKHDWEKTGTTATCTEDGTATFVCKNDATHTKTESESKFGHDMPENWKIDQPADCLTAGAKSRFCSRFAQCGYYENVAIQPLGHTFGEVTQAVAATCVAKGNEAYKQCETCNLYFAENAQKNSVDGAEDATSFETAIDETNHVNTTNHDKVDATCFEIGYTAGTYCEDCETWVSGHEEIPAIGHEDKVHHAKVDATCVATGTIEYWACPDCGKNYSDEECTVAVTDLEIAEDAANHTNLKNCAEVPADCLTSGFEAGIKCEDCGDWYSGHDVIEALGHDFAETVAATDATCLGAGNEAYKQCRNCHLYFAGDAATDAADGETVNDNFILTQLDHLYTGEIRSDGDGEEATHSFKCVNGCDEYGAAEAHNWDDGEVTTEAECLTIGVLTYTCEDDNCGATYTADIPATGHTFSEVTGYEAPDCVTAGNEAYKHCPDCDKYFAEDADRDAADGEESADAFTIPALEHDFDEDFTVDLKATCEFNGSKSRHCSRCNEKTDVTAIEAREHNFVDTTVETPATCLTSGIMNQKCDNDTETDEYVACTLTRTRVIDPLGHDFDEIVDEVEATCVATGKRAYKQCFECEKYFADDAEENDENGEDNTEAFVIPVDTTNHDWSESVSSVSNGTEKTHFRTCERTGCNAKHGIGHNFTADFKEYEAATCLEEGSERAFCSYCKGFVYRIIPKTGHKDADKNNKCDVCGTTIEEKPADPAPELPDEGGTKPACSCNCHKNGIIGFIYDLVLFFQRLLGLNKTCICGEAHY